MTWSPPWLSVSHFAPHNSRAIVVTSVMSIIAVQTAEAGGTKRKRNRDGIMRLGGPANGTGSLTNNGFVNGRGNGASAIIDRTGGVSFRNPADIRAFALGSAADRSGPAL